MLKAFGVILMTLFSPHMFSIQITPNYEEKTIITEIFPANETFVLFLLPLILWLK